MSYHANSEDRRRLIAGLRDLAEFLDRHPQVPVPTRAYVMVFPPDGTDAEMFAEIDAIAGRRAYSSSPRSIIREFRTTPTCWPKS